MHLDPEVEQEQTEKTEREPRNGYGSHRYSTGGEESHGTFGALLPQLPPVGSATASARITESTLKTALTPGAARCHYILEERVLRPATADWPC